MWSKSLQPARTPTSNGGCQFLFHTAKRMHCRTFGTIQTGDGSRETAAPGLSCTTVTLPERLVLMGSPVKNRPLGIGWGRPHDETACFRSPCQQCSISGCRQRRTVWDLTGCDGMHTRAIQRQPVLPRERDFDSRARFGTAQPTAAGWWMTGLRASIGQTHQRCIRGPFFPASKRRGYAPARTGTPCPAPSEKSVVGMALARVFCGAGQGRGASSRLPSRMSDPRRWSGENSW